MTIAITSGAVPKDMAATTVADVLAPSRKGSGLSKPAAWTRRGGVWKKRDAVLRRGVAAVTDTAVGDWLRHQWTTQRNSGLCWRTPQRSEWKPRASAAKKQL